MKVVQKLRQQVTWIEGGSETSTAGDVEWRCFRKSAVVLGVTFY